MVAASLCSLSLTEEERRKITAYVTPTDNTYNNILSLCVLCLIILIQDLRLRVENSILQS